MSISAEWGTARDTTITAVPGGNYPFGTEAQVTEQAALVFDPQSGGGFVLEGDVHDLAAQLDRAKRQLAPFLAADALAEWDSYCKHQNELMNEGEQGASDEYEDLHLFDLTNKLAAALRALDG